MDREKHITHPALTRRQFLTRHAVGGAGIAWLLREKNLHAQSIAARASEAKNDPIFPLKISESRRYLVDSQGKPFLLLGDTPWFLQKLPLEIFGDGSQTRDFINVSDVVNATVAALESDLTSRAFNIASGKETTILKLAEIMQGISGLQREFKFSPPRTGDIARSLADTTKARNELGLTAGTSLHDGLETTIQWLAKKSRT